MRNAEATIWIIRAIVFTVLFLGWDEANATIVFNDGLTHEIDFYIDDVVEVMDNTMGEPTTVRLLAGGMVQWQLKVYGHSQLYIIGGSLENDLWFYDESKVDISGGTIRTHLSAYGLSEVTIWGGTFGDNYFGDPIAGYEQSFISIYGGEFSADTQLLSKDFSQIVLGGDFNYPYGLYRHVDFPSGGRLTGILAMGNTIDNTFSIEDNGSIRLIPEPATLLLLSLGVVMLRRRRV